MHKIHTIITHDGPYHPDDVYAVAIFLSINPGATVVRTRDEAVLASALSDPEIAVVDVGRQYDPVMMNFDHHQKEGAGFHPSGAAMASFGLVWGRFGSEMASSFLPGENVYVISKATDLVNMNLVEATDAADNGQLKIHGVVSYGGETKSTIPVGGPNDIFFALAPERDATPEAFLAAFMKAVDLATLVIRRVVVNSARYMKAQSLLAGEMNGAPSPIKVVPITDPNLPWADAAIEIPGLNYVIFQDVCSHHWYSVAVAAREHRNRPKKPFPIAWRGLAQQNLQDATGVPSSVFCHRFGLLLVTKTLESAVQLTQWAQAA